MNYLNLTNANYQYHNHFSDGVVAGSYSCKFDTHHASCDAVLALKTYSNQNRKPEFGISFGVSV